MSSDKKSPKPSTKSCSDVVVTPQQEKVLECEFKNEKNWDEITVTLVVAECGLCEKDVEKWYNWRKKEWRKHEGLRCEGSGTLTDM